MSQHQLVPTPQSAAPTRAPSGALLRRTCACGTTAAPASSTCPDCARKKLQPKLVIGGTQDAEEREADRVASDVMRDRSAGAVGAAASVVQRAPAGAVADSAAGVAAPPIVDQVLAGSGQALDPVTRGFFERRFGRGFGEVRVHADGQAAASAQAVDAHAYTVGHHVVFGASRYAPGTAAGRHLLAHELTHVVQQGASLRRSSMSPAIDSGRDDDETEQPVQRLRRTPAIVGLDEAGPKADLTGKTEDQMFRLAERDKKLAECKKAAAPDPAACKPATPPDWSQFTGAPDKTNDMFDAWTVSTVESVDVPSQKCEESITGYPSGPAKRFQGVFAPGASWVKPAFGDPTTQAAADTVKPLGDCNTFFDQMKPGDTLPTPWSMSSKGSAACPAAATIRGDPVTKKSDCAPVITKDVADRTMAESARLLKHEQGHLALTCALAKKGNALLDAGTSFATIESVINRKRAAAERLYDNETRHGCLAGPQSSWEGKIAAGLPDITLVKP